MRFRRETLSRADRTSQASFRPTTSSGRRTTTTATRTTTITARAGPGGGRRADDHRQDRVQTREIPLQAGLRRRLLGSDRPGETRGLENRRGVAPGPFGAFLGAENQTNRQLDLLRFESEVQSVSVERKILWEVGHQMDRGLQFARRKPL